MQSTYSTLFDKDSSTIPCLEMEDLDTGIIAKWWAWPSTKIDSTKFTENMTEIPVYNATGVVTNPNSVGYKQTKYAFKLDPDNNKKMLVVPLRECSRRANATYDIHRYTRPFQVSVGTPMEVVDSLMKHLSHRNSPTEERVRLDYGDVNTLKSWEETYDVEGYIGVSTGKYRSFLMINNKRSIGGSPILTDCILSIRTARKERNKGSYEYHYFYILEELFTNPLNKIEVPNESLCS